MKTVRINAAAADHGKWSDTQQASRSYRLAVDKLKYLVSLDYTLVKAMEDRSVPITDNLRDTRDLLVKIAENIEKIDVLRKRYEDAIRYFEHSIRARVETTLAHEFDQVILRDKDSILSRLEEMRVGDAVDFILRDAEGGCVRLSRVYLDDNHNWVSLDDAPYVTGRKAAVADPIDRFNLFTKLEV